VSGVDPSGEFEGEILVDRQTQQFRSVRDSESAGIAIIFQELSLVKEMTVGENIFLGREPSRFGVIDWAKLYHNAASLLRELHLDIDPRTPVGSLGIGRQQLVEIAKALSQEAKILVLDEPTAALTESEVETLFAIITKLRSRGVGLIYISHKLEEVFRMSDRITVLRDGKTVGTHAAADLTRDKVIAAMVGRDVGDIFPESTHELGDTALEVKGLNVYSIDRPDKLVVKDVSFSVRKGEVLGIAGLMGSGRTELLTALFGAWQGKNSGDVSVAGRKVQMRSESDAIENGIAFVTEDRKRYGLVLDQTISDNMTLVGLRQISGKLLTDRSKELSAVRTSMNSLRVKAGSPLVVAGTLSGGNQQKVVLGKWLLTNPKVLFLDEPTRGIDVGAKQEIYAEINKLAQEGLAIVLVSSELPEVSGLSTGVIGLKNGGISGEFTREDRTAEKVMEAATGGH